MRLFGQTVTLVGTAILATGAAQAQAQAPGDLRDMVGARAGQAESGLNGRGYEYVNTQTGSDRKWSNWWNARTQTCVTIATVEGRYDSITTTLPADCNKSASNSDYASSRPERPGYGGSGGGYDDYYDRGRSLTLICYGEGRKPGQNYRSGYEWNPRRGRYEYRGFIENGQQRFDSEVQIEIRGRRGYIHLAGKLVPPINSRGQNGWWELQNLNVTRDMITANYRLNGINKPKVKINRRSGRIAIDGIEKFRGDCDLGDWNGGNRF